MKIKIFQSMFERKAERLVNEFLARGDIEVISLQYGATSFNFSVLISYREIGPDR